jgi:hypothetical protein
MGDETPGATIYCRECRAYVERAHTDGTPIRAFIDWQPRDEHLCPHPPWQNCRFFVEAIAEFVRQQVPPKP